MNEEQLEALNQELNGLGAPIDFKSKEQSDKYNRLTKEIEQGKKTLDLNNINKVSKNIELLSKSGMNESNNLDFDSEEKMEGIADAFGVSRSTPQVGSSNNAADNSNSVTNTANSNNSGINLTSGGVLSAPTRLSLEQNNAMFAGQKADVSSMVNDSFKTKKSNAPTLIKQNNEISSSRKRGGLFGNYGKQVEIKKTFNKSTGRTNKQKFVDGELFSDRNSRQDVRRAGKNAASNKRTNRRAGRK